MILYSFNIKKKRLRELQLFIKENLPNTRFSKEPYNVGNLCYVSLDMDSTDNNKINELFNKWHDEDTLPKTKKEFFGKILNILKT